MNYDNGDLTESLITEKVIEFKIFDFCKNTSNYANVIASYI